MFILTFAIQHLRKHQVILDRDLNSNYKLGQGNKLFIFFKWKNKIPLPTKNEFYSVNFITAFNMLKLTP